MSLSHLYRGEAIRINNAFFTYNEFGYENRVNYMSLSSNISKKFDIYRANLGATLNKVWVGGDENSYSFIVNSLFDVTLLKNLKTNFKLSFEDYNAQEKTRSSNIFGGEIGMRYRYLNSSLGYKKYSKQNGERYDVSKNELNFALNLSYMISKDHWLL